MRTIRMCHPALMVIFISAHVYAANVSIPNAFTNGQVADANQINQNFQVLADALNSGNIGGVAESLSLNDVMVAGNVNTNTLNVSGQGNIAGTLFPLTTGSANQYLQMDPSGSNLQWTNSDVIPSMVRVHTSIGYGTTNTMIRRFGTVVTNTGSAITYADDAANGGSYSINEDGFYSISYSDRFSGASHMSVSLNSSQLSTVSISLPLTDVLCMAASAAADYSVSVSWSGHLQAGDVVRAHADGAGTSTTNGGLFTIAKAK